MKSFFAFACCVVSGLAFGAVVSFTGAESFDLSNPANWEGGELPGEDDVAVVDYAGRPARRQVLLYTQKGTLLIFR